MESEKVGVIDIGGGLLLAPDDLCGVETPGRSKDGLELLYRRGYNDGEKGRAFLRTAEI